MLVLSFNFLVPCLPVWRLPPSGGLSLRPASSPRDSATPLSRAVSDLCVPPVRAASSEGSIPMQEGERLLVIEMDQGDGWTRVRRHDSLEEGFVPTAYLQVHAER